MLHTKAQHHFVEDLTTTHANHPLSLLVSSHFKLSLQAKPTSHRARGAGGSGEEKPHCDEALD